MLDDSGVSIQSIAWILAEFMPQATVNFLPNS